MFQVFIAEYLGQFDLLNFERFRRTVMSPSTDRVRTNIVTPPPGGMHLNSPRHSDSTARAPLVGQHITPMSGGLPKSSQSYVILFRIVAGVSSSSTIQSAHFHLVTPLIRVFPNGFEHSCWITENKFNLMQRIHFRNFSIAQIRCTGAFLRQLAVDFFLFF